MNNTQEADRLTFKSGLTLIFQDSKARAQLAEMLADLMTKYGADNPPPYPVTSVNGMVGDVIVQGGGGGGEVLSVNGKVGVVELDAEDVGALPDTVTIPSKTSDLTNDSGFVNAAGAAAAAPVKSVNGQTGAVMVTVPTKTSDLTNDSGFVNASGAATAAPVQSVNGQTGDVTVPSISALDVYPVGSIYMSVNSADPSTLFGGTWEQLEDTFLLAAGTNHSAGSTGGEETHTLTVDEMPTHDGHLTSTASGGTLARYLSVNALTPYGSGGRGWTEVSGSEAMPASNNRGGSQPHNNMPPYLAVYMWKRTA